MQKNPNDFLHMQFSLWPLPHNWIVYKSNVQMQIIESMSEYLLIK